MELDMRQHNKFHTTVDFTTTKEQFDSSQNRRIAIMEWLFDNVGFSANIELDDHSNWDSVHNYSKDGRNIIETYSFKDSKNAMIFALKWS
jgi:hypothetical protein